MHGGIKGDDCANFKRFRGGLWTSAPYWLLHIVKAHKLTRTQKCSHRTLRLFADTSEIVSRASCCRPWRCSSSTCDVHPSTCDKSTFVYSSCACLQYGPVCTFMTKACDEFAPRRRKKSPYSVLGALQNPDTLQHQRSSRLPPDQQHAGQVARIPCLHCTSTSHSCFHQKRFITSQKGMHYADIRPHARTFKEYALVRMDQRDF